ncbi:MAG: capsular polysaccharide export protein, partial [Campylobacterota bacterium]|nr:capsular polysaccharide export protein [Campylobacterota bacterium]
KEAIKKNINRNDIIYVWGRKNYKEIYEYAQKNNIKISVVEDGFIRSISLGSDLTQPFSLVVDTQGIYFDPTTASDLEKMLSEHQFDDTIRSRASSLISTIVKTKFSKYNGFEHKKIELDASAQGKKIILVPGQVEDDASIILGAYGQSTLDLLEQARNSCKDAYIIYKPHPDVLSGNRTGLKDKSAALKYCDLIIENYSIDSCIEVCNEVHTLTSTAGFDALLRGKKVFVYGMPFYAGWGLTIDKFHNEKRGRKLKLEEFAAATLLLYPRYIHPKTLQPCEAEEMLHEMIKMQEHYFNSKYYKLYCDIKVFLLRKIRRAIEFVLKIMGKR